MKEEEEAMEEVTLREVARALDEEPRTVIYWHHNKGLPAWKPFDSDRAGFRSTVGDVRAFLAKYAKDGGRALTRFDRYLADKRREGQNNVSRNAGNNGTNVLAS